MLLLIAIGNTFENKIREISYVNMHSVLENKRSSICEFYSNFITMDRLNNFDFKVYVLNKKQFI